MKRYQLQIFRFSLKCEEREEMNQVFRRGAPSVANKKAVDEKPHVRAKSPYQGFFLLVPQ